MVQVKVLSSALKDPALLLPSTLPSLVGMVTVVVVPGKVNVVESPSPWLLSLKVK